MVWTGVSVSVCVVIGFSRDQIDLLELNTAIKRLARVCAVSPHDGTSERGGDTPSPLRRLRSSRILANVMASHAAGGQAAWRGQDLMLAVTTLTSLVGSATPTFAPTAAPTPLGSGDAATAPHEPYDRYGLSSSQWQLALYVSFGGVAVLIVIAMGVYTGALSCRKKKTQVAPEPDLSQWKRVGPLPGAPRPAQPYHEEFDKSTHHTSPIWDDEMDAGIGPEPSRTRAASERPRQQAYHDGGRAPHRSQSQAGGSREFKVFDAFSPQRNRPMALPE